MKIGTRVYFNFTCPFKYERILGSGEIVGDSIIIGTDYGYTVKRDIDGALLDVRCFNCTPIEHK